MIKLKYKTLVYKNLIIHYAKYRKNKNIRLSVSSNGMIKVTCPHYTLNEEILNFVIEKEPWINRILLKTNSTRNLSILPPLKKSQKNNLLLRISDFVEKYEIILNIKVNRISLRKMKTLWGSCSYIEKNICFNSMLYHMSDYFLEYIVLHEMAHLFVHNHSKAFYDLVKKYMPDYKKRWTEYKKVSLV